MPETSLDSEATDSERSAVEQLTLQLQKQVKVLEQSGKSWIDDLDESQKLRFLRGHSMNVKEAQTFIEEAALWRHEYGTNSITKDWPLVETPAVLFLRNYFPMGSCGLDNRGRPVHYFKLAMTDFPALQKHVGVDLLVKHTVYLFEKSMKRSTLGNEILVVDLGGDAEDKNRVLKLTNLKSWLTAALEYVKALGKVVDPFYPESFLKVYFVRAPGYISGMYNTFNEQLPKNTRDKVHIIRSSSSLDKLLEFVPLESLPSEIGGGSKEVINSGGRISDEDIKLMSAD